MKKFTSDQIKDFVSRPSFDAQTILKKDPSWPKISVVTPSYNQGQFLEWTILSVLNQNYPNLEYIIMDGGSTDSSVGIIKKYEKYLAYWISEKDGGQSDAIRKGFARCTGQVLAYLNSDDIYLPGALFLVGGAFRKKPHSDVLYGNLYHVDEGGQIIGERRLTPYIPFLSKLGLLYGGFGIYQEPTFWTRDLYDRVGGIDADFVHCMDNDLFVRFSLIQAQFVFTRTYLAAARKHANTKTATLHHVAGREYQAIKTKYGNRRTKLLGSICMNLTKAIRLLLYVAQGDVGYLCMKCLNCRPIIR